MRNYVTAVTCSEEDGGPKGITYLCWKCQSKRSIASTEASVEDNNAKLFLEPIGSPARATLEHLIRNANEELFSASTVFTFFSATIAFQAKCWRKVD
jgi:hypothetical protein